MKHLDFCQGRRNLESLQYQEVLKILECNFISILMQSLSQFGNLSVRFDMCITLKKLRSQNCTVKLHKLLHCWQSFPNEKAPFCITERTKILMTRFWEKQMLNWDIEEDYSSKKGQAITQFLSGCHTDRWTGTPTSHWTNVVVTEPLPQMVWVAAMSPQNPLTCRHVRGGTATPSLSIRNS